MTDQHMADQQEENFDQAPNPIDAVSDQTNGRVLMYWGFPEYVAYKRSPNWYFTAVFVGGFLVVYGLFTGNYMFALIIVLAALIISFQSQRQPENVSITLTTSGVAVGTTFFAYRDLKQFAIVYDPPAVKKLYLEFKSSWRPRLGVPLQDENPVKVRKILVKYMNEDLEREAESVSDQISRVLKI